MLDGILPIGVADLDWEVLRLSWYISQDLRD